MRVPGVAYVSCYLTVNTPNPKHTETAPEAFR